LVLVGGELDDDLFRLPGGREQAAGERGWRAYLTVDDADADEVGGDRRLLPGCGAREFQAGR
jgi:hypothetical protein